MTEEEKVPRLGRRSWQVLEAGYAVGLVVVITEPPSGTKIGFTLTMKTVSG